MSHSVISFDAAGTLIQVCEPVGQTYAAFAREHGVHVEEAALKQAFRNVWGSLPAKEWPEGQCAADDDRSWWHELVNQVFTEALRVPLPEATLEPLFEALYMHFSLPEAWSVYEDVKPVLDKLAQDHRLCVLSNFDRRLRGVLKGHGLDGYFDHIILSSEVGVSKPHPRIFDTAKRLMNAAEVTRWHVGDDERCDIQGAVANGWKPVWISRPERDLWDLVEKVHLEANSSLHMSQ
ncbi:HAD-IA family hydrolase [Prosthecobacter dejongeii]|uniref:Putative hydrolase of the HAD superfamily n=1 Tax=Prosthecobacter dejongeii TaxID=48465 RepID=A0A7W7YJY6_9BACT|nr:HAD-IA family hydrolase [Prosthecobacter dejongeii]MBB5037275.1 putative hydrolase of the HAD superfamily [Prosthecobacter dejongeii]